MCLKRKVFVRPAISALSQPSLWLSTKPLTTPKRWVRTDRPSSSSIAGSLDTRVRTLGHNSAPSRTCGILRSCPYSSPLMYLKVRGTQPKLNSQSLTCSWLLGLPSSIPVTTVIGVLVEAGRSFSRISSCQASPLAESDPSLRYITFGGFITFVIGFFGIALRSCSSFSSFISVSCDSSASALGTSKRHP